MKRTVKLIVHSLVFVSILGCTSTPRGYDTVEELYQASLVAIKSKDKTQIENFVKTILSDESTAKYMEKNNCVYRGFPQKLKEYPNAIDSSIVYTTQIFYDFALQLEGRYGNLDDLQFVGFDRDISSPKPLNEPQCKCQDILFIEPQGLFVFKNNNDTIKYKIGELLKVNKEWKAFTLRL